MKTLHTFAALAVAAIIQSAFAQQVLETSSLTIVSGETEHAFTVELANDPEEIRIGLMDRQQMDPNVGMLFDFGQPREANMWMKNTLLPLDMLFVAADGTVLAIARDTEPMSTRIINPGVEVKAVLELNAGRCAELGIQPGDVLRHEIFGNTAQ